MEEEIIRLHLPFTYSFTKENLYSALRLFASIYIKPDYGKEGKGVYKILKNDDKLLVKFQSRLKAFSNIDSLYQFIRRQTSSKLILQQGIELERFQGKPYDIRAMLQRRPKGEWVCTGWFARVGSPQKIVTNLAQGGKVYSVSKLFEKKGLTSYEQYQRLEDIHNLSLRVAKCLSSKKSGMHQMGVDWVFDQTGRLWILEVNTFWPVIYPLKKIDPLMYKRMRSYARSYGRRE